MVTTSTIYPNLNDRTFTIQILNVSFSYFLVVSFSILFFFLFSCTKDKIPRTYNGYPEDVGKIILNNCATPGCHNDKSYEAAAGINLSSWENLFNGSKGNAVVLPFCHEQSSLLYYMNTYSDLGIQLTPTMPLNASPLSHEEIILMRNWIADGAPDKNGFVKFSDNTQRKKIYVVNQACDMVTVFDSETKLAMRCIKVGISAAAESPHTLKISPDGNFWYVCFLNSAVIQKFRTTDDELVGNISIGAGNWNTLTFSADGKTAFAVDWSSSGAVAVVNTETMQLIKILGGNNFFNFPHGCAANGVGDTLYITAQTGNFIYKVPVNDPTNYDRVVLQPGESANTTSKYDAHEIMLSPDSVKYFVTCQKSNDVRVFKRYDDSWLATIPVGTFPQEMSISKTTDYLFVSSPEDTVSFLGKRGSVSVVNYKTNSFVKTIFTGFQPHGLAVDDEKKLVYVANRNVNSSGPAPHHSSVCGGRNGYVTIIDMNTLEPVENFKAEVAPDPYSVAVRK